MSSATPTRRIPAAPMVLGVLICCLAVFGPAAFDPADGASTKDENALAKTFHDDVATLASDAMEGRGLTTKGIRRAADWIEGRLEKIGLQPAFDGSYRQAFQVKTGVVLAEGNRLEGVTQEDWIPLGFTSRGEFDGELVFAGYGIESPSIGYRELEGLDLKGKVVLMLRYEPQERDDNSPFDGKKPSRWSALRYKAMQARERGAAAVVFVTGPLQDEENDKLPALKNDGPESPAGIPAIQVRTSVAQKWLDAAGVNLEQFQKAVDRDLMPRSVDKVGVRVKGRVAVEVTWTSAENIAGIIPGKGAMASECIVVGAHYDHLGFGGEGSMTPNVTEIHNGADDNASGSVAALMIGEALKARLAEAPAHRTVAIALFSAEEVGLAGSSYYVDHPPFPIQRTVAMINLDMVGRLRDETLIALGSDSASEWTDRIEHAAKEVPGLKVSSSGDGYGPSDQTSFYAVEVPVLHLFTGSHNVYHTPGDDTPTIDARGGARVVMFASAVAEDLARENAKLSYVRAGGAPAMTGDSRGYGAWLGTVPDYSAMQGDSGGVLLSDVRKGGPADLAGIKGGDRIIGMAGSQVQNLYDMTFALQDHRPGDTIEVVVIRSSAEVKMKATLGDRALMAQAAAPGSPGSPVQAGASPPSGHAQPSPAPPAHAAPSPASPHSPAASPHGSSPDAAAAKNESAIDPFYEGRPGADFAIAAGTPFAARFDGEKHLTDVRQLTSGGENAEAYFSPDGKHLILQVTAPGAACDQQYILDLAGGEMKRVSTGEGRTTCGYYDWPESDRVIYASTHDTAAECPAPPDRSQGYVWAIYPGYELYESRVDGTGTRRLTESPGYDAEATWCHRGGRLVFTSVRDGDLDLYSMEEDGHVKRLTNTPGYDGGAFYSPDCKEIVWRAGRPAGEELADYQKLLAQGLVRPNALEIYMMNADGSNVRQITDNGAANFCPIFTADGKKVIYASNAGANPREFDLWLVDKKGGEAERITYAPGFDGFPQFSPDGRYIVWGSNRSNPQGRETNIFIARWVD